MNLSGFGVMFGLCVSLILSGCATSSRKVSLTAYPKDRVFPLGVYRHDVELSLPAHEDHPAQNFRFSGLVKIEPNQIQALALSAMGITVFKITDHLSSGEVTTEIYIDQVKKYEPKIREYYALLKKLLLLKTDPKADSGIEWTKTNSNQLPVEIKTVAGPPATLFFNQYDAHQIPEAIVIDGKSFNVSVKVSGYEI